MASAPMVVIHWCLSYLSRNLTYNTWTLTSSSEHNIKRHRWVYLIDSKLSSGISYKNGEFTLRSDNLRFGTHHNNHMRTDSSSLFNNYCTIMYAWIETHLSKSYNMVAEVIAVSPCLQHSKCASRWAMRTTVPCGRPYRLHIVIKCIWQKSFLTLWQTGNSVKQSLENYFRAWIRAITITQRLWRLILISATVLKILLACGWREGRERQDLIWRFSCRMTWNGGRKSSRRWSLTSSICRNIYRCVTGQCTNQGGWNASLAYQLCLARCWRSADCWVPWTSFSHGTVTYDSYGRW